MRLKFLIFVALVFSATLAADDVSKSHRLLCAANQVYMCVDGAECYSVQPAEVDVPQFFVLDADSMILSTTEASTRKRSTVIDSLERHGGLIHARAKENERFLSFVVDESTGIMTLAVTSDGFTLSIFGACTDFG